MDQRWRINRNFHNSNLLKSTFKLIVTLLIIMAAFKVLAAYYDVNRVTHYLPLHSILEMTSVIIAGLIFSVGWSNRHRNFPGYIHLLSYSFLAVAIIDCFHLLSYPGMPNFVTPNTPEKSIDFWLLGRTFVALVLLVGVLVPELSDKYFRHRYAALAVTLIGTFTLSYLILFYGSLLPRTFVADEGLTDFKIGYEYSVMLIHLATLMLLGVRKHRASSYNATALFHALCIMVLSEYLFTQYQQVNDTDIFLGHVFKTLAYVYLYRAIYIEAIELPYNLVKKAKREVQFLADNVPVFIAQFDKQKRIRFINQPYAQLLGCEPDAVVGEPYHQVLDQHTRHALSPLMTQALAGESCSLELTSSDASTSTKTLFYRFEPQRDHDGKVEGFTLAISDITELNQTVESARQTNELLNSIIENVPVCIFWKDKDLRYLGCNTAFAQDGGYDSPESLLGKSDFDMPWKDQAEGYRSDDQIVIDSGTAKLNIVEPLTRFDAKEQWLITSKVPLRDKDGAIIGVLGVYANITDIRNTETELRKLSQAVEQSPHVVFITDADKRIEYVNQAFSKITGFSRKQALGQTPSLLRSGKNPDEVYQHINEHLLRGETWRGELVNRTRTGTDYVASVIIAPVRQPDGEVTHYLCIQENITLQKQAQQHIEMLAHFDQLTGLPNRELLQHRFQQAIIAAEQSGNEFALMFIDLDNFKNINDSLGHNIGDQVLIRIADRIKRVSREEDTISRLGGDEYILILPNTNKSGAEHVAKKLIDTVAQPMMIQHYELVITPSIGIALYPEHGEDFENLSKNSDTAMYHAKRHGRNNFYCYNPSMQEHTARTLMLESALRHALEENQLEVHYQPQIAIGSREIIGAEALLRWHHPEFGWVSPAEFIPIAESGGLINPIGDWVLRSVCKQMRQWYDQGMPQLVLAVNLSAVQLRQNHVANTITEILDEFSLPYHCLELELTEAVAMSNYDAAVELMNRLKDKGVQISIDDFGTGYSSLAYLKRFSVSKLKIDQSFIRDSSTSLEDKAIISAIINMAASLGIKTIAEGVETEEQLRYLEREGCNEVQGYHISRPLAATNFERFVLDYAPAVSQLSAS